MTRNELLTIIGFIEKTRAPAVECLGVSVPDPYWNMVLFLLRRHLENKLVTVTSLAAAAGVPYGTAMRKIDELIESGLLIKRPRTQTGKSFSLHPSQNLIDSFQEFAQSGKTEILCKIKPSNLSLDGFLEKAGFRLSEIPFF